MRCPKCGYISFDHLESCKKCGKNIGEASADINGTVFAVSAPAFLDLEYEETGGQSGSVDDIFDNEETLDEVEDTLDLSFEDDDPEGEDEIVVDIEDAEVLDDFELVDEADDELTIDLDGFEEVTSEDEFTLELGDEEEPPESKDDGLQLDFGDIDISDLAPPEEDADEPVAEALNLEEGISIEEVAADGPPPVPDSVPPGSGLEDLQVEGLDLDIPAPLVAGSMAGDKLMPSVKTGTALDDFEIDLGELTSGDK